MSDIPELRRKTPKEQEITRIAFRPSKRQRLLDSRKAENISGRPDLQYKGEDLKKGPR